MAATITAISFRPNCPLYDTKNLFQKCHPPLHGATFLKSKIENRRFSFSPENKILRISLSVWGFPAPNQKLFLKQLLRLLITLLLAWPCLAPAKDYRLTPQQIAPDTYILEGHNEDFSFENGGNIVNTGFIVTAAGVIVINTGPSRLYGEQLRAAISNITDQPVIKIYISKLHPDHYLGNQAFPDVPIVTLAETIAGIQAQGDMFTDNMYRMVGHWMQGTEMIVPKETAAAGRETIGGHELEVIALRGHTPSDLLLLDHTTGVLFAGGVVFHNRAPTTPHADLDAWIAELESVKRLPFKIIVPSHGPVAQDNGPIEQTLDYVSWLRDTFQQAARAGLDMAEVLYIEIPVRFQTMAVLENEYQRSVSHLYSDFEAAHWPLVGGASN